MYPTNSEYLEAIKAAEDNFEQLKHLRPVLGEDGEPVMTGGNFAEVFKMKDEQTGKLHAVKCFRREQEGRAEAYRMIAEELEYVSSTFLTPIKYLDKELFVDTNAGNETEFPVLLMDWVEGDTLDKYIRKHLDDQYELSLLAYQFSRLAMWLMPQPFAHGDLKPDNILVKSDGTLVLVDYDGMYVPAMKGQKARELGSPDFRHPSRTETDFDEHIDDFSLASILLSLKAIALQPSLLEEYGASDRLLFSEKDYRNLSESSALGALQPLMQDAELASLYSLYILALSQNNLSQVSFRLFNLSRPDRSQYEEENLSTEVTEEDLANAWTDEFGVMYSKDRKKLLKVPTEIRTYSIENGTKIICNKAFQSTLLTQVIIPNSVLCIGDNAFCGCCLTSIEIPDNVQSIGKWAFSYNALNSVTIPQNVKHIGKGAFGSCGSLICIDVDNENKFYDSRNDCNAIIETKSNTLIVGCQNTIIPNNVKSIGERAFYGCYNLSFIFIPKEVLNIGLRAFDSCEILKRISVDKDNKIFDSRNDCNAIIETKTNTLIVGCQNTIIPNNVNCIGEWAFSGCNKLSAINIPESVLSINEGAFSGCSGLSTIELPKGLKELGRRVFSNSGIESVIIPDGIEVISESLFNYCRRLTSVTLPNSVTTIDNSAFQNCRPLSFISMSDKVIAIGDWAFASCSSLPSIMLSNSVQTVGKGAFYNCESLKTIFIPLHSKQKFEQLLPDYKDIIVEQDEDANLSTEVTKEDLANAWVDEFGVKYSIDRKRLLRVNETLTSYSVKEGTKVICDESFGYDFGNRYIKSINIPNSVVRIGYAAFRDCEVLTNITLPDSVELIGEKAFSGCKSLSEIFLPNSITQLGDCAFYECESLLSINIPNSISFIGESVFSGCSFSHIKIPNTIKKIGNYAFYRCNNLEEVSIPDSVTDLGAGAFGSCSSLKHVKIPNSITELGYEAFSGSALTHIELPKSITKIGSRAFWDSSLTQLEIPYSVIKIEEGAFYGSCLEEIVLPESITEIADSAFYDCFSLKQISIPNSVTRIGDSAFYGCSCLSQIGIPDSIKFIGGGAFLYCESLTQITIPDSVVELGNVVFSNCHSLKYITFSGVVNKIGDDIFHECDALDKILISTGTRNKFEELLPEYKDKLVEISNVVSITFDNSSTSKVDRCRVFKKDNDWKLEIVYKNGMKVDYPHSLLQGNQSIEFDKQTIEKIQLYVGYCEGFYINPKAVEVDFEYSSKFSAKILFDSDFIEISGITWGLNNNINEWKVKGLRSFNIEERLAVNRAEVVPSDFGNSVCFFMNAGGQTYIPLDKNSELCVGDALDMNTAKIITLCRKGKSDIVRVME